MGQDRAGIAIARIERALARIEAAAARPQAATARDDGGEELRSLHQALRGKVEGAIAQIDTLLAAGEKG